MCRNSAAGEQDQRHHQPGLRMAEQERIVLRHHHQQHRQRQIVVVHRALLADLAVFRIRRPRRAIICAIIFFWFGMITANTLTAMMVPTKRADMDEGAAAGEHLGVEHGREQDQREHRDREQQVWSPTRDRHRPS